MDELDLIRAKQLRAGSDLMCHFAGIFVRAHGPHQTGFLAEGHRHQLDHVTLVISGEVMVDWARYYNGDSFGVIEARGTHGPISEGMPFIVKADVFHTIRVLRGPAIWNCIFRTPDDLVGIPLVHEVSNTYHGVLPLG